LKKQIELVGASVVVLLGGSALWSVLGENEVKKWHGKVVVRDGKKYFVTYHPAAAMRFPAVRKAMVKDFEKLGDML
jgi:DNA polymerase